MESAPTELDAWLEQGIAQGWITRPYCATHEGPPLTDEEAWDEDMDDACCYAVRLLVDD